jgi:FkbH-like protein
MDVDVCKLGWLESPPADFRARLRNLPPAGPEWYAGAHRLSLYRLLGNDLSMLGTAAVRVAREAVGVVRLGVLSNCTTDLLIPALAASALRHGILLDPVNAAFDQVLPQALDPDSEINRAHCDYVLLALDHRGLRLTPTPGDLGCAQETLAAALEYVDVLCKGLQAASRCTLILQTVPQVSEFVFGNIERCLAGTQQWLIDHCNRELRERAASFGHRLLDAAALAEAFGLASWHDPVQWALGKFPFAHAATPLYADWVGRLVAAAHGKAHKALVLDLDNTLWGGVIGDDGLNGIVLGNGDPTGEAFLRIQRLALELRARGIVLAVASKNDDAIARGPFRSHPDMLLREEHIAVFKANWRSKVENIREIADALGLGLDALVLLDDNPAERNQMRELLPEIAVPELPDDPAYFPDFLLAAGYFESTAFTAEDRFRADQYSANVARAQLKENAIDITSWLGSLQMRAICGPFDPLSRSRVAQLINKTNQFNLTTKRYTEAQVESFEKSQSGLTVQIRLMDRLGDNGIVAIVICTEDSPDWVIDTWLMSCRVLKRCVEQATLSYLVARAKEAGVRALVARYIPTERNAMVGEHYPKLGFTRVAGMELPGEWWRLEVASYIPNKLPIEIVRAGGEPM